MLLLSHKNHCDLKFYLQETTLVFLSVKRSINPTEINLNNFNTYLSEKDTCKRKRSN